MKKLFTILFIIIITGLFEKELFAQNGITYNGTSVAVGFNYNSAGNISTFSVGTLSYSLGWDIVRNNNESITIGSGAEWNLKLNNSSQCIALGMGSTVPTMRITKAGNNYGTGHVIIGNLSSTDNKLHIHSDANLNSSIMISTTSDNNRAIIYFKNEKNNISVGSDNIMNLSATSYSFTTGKVGIGCVNNMNDFALAVQGGVVSTKVSVLDIDSWPDFVFGNNYKLMNLYELEQYINANQHLPEVPSAEEVSASGIDLGEMNAILLQKVEELTLHIIELQKQIDELKAR